MTSIRDEPAPAALTAAGVVAALIGESDDRARQLGRQLAAWGEGYALGFSAGVDVGRGAEAAERDEAWNAIARPKSESLSRDFGLHDRRWTLRGEPRTRATFGQPHPGDYRGGPVPWDLPKAGAA